MGSSSGISNKNRMHHFSQRNRGVIGKQQMSPTQVGFNYRERRKVLIEYWTSYEGLVVLLLNGHEHAHDIA